MTANKRYTVRNACPQCGCTEMTTMTPEEIKARFGDAPNVQMECQECAMKYQAPVKDVCPEWDQECRLAK